MALDLVVAEGTDQVIDLGVEMSITLAIVLDLMEGFPFRGVDHGIPKIQEVNIIKFPFDDLLVYGLEQC